MEARNVAVWLLWVLAGCSAPDYSAVRDWARTASISAEFPLRPRSKATTAGELERVGHNSRCEGSGTGALMAADAETATLAMQAALAIYLSSLATLASDGTLPYREDPFTELSEQAAAGNAAGGQAVKALGALLRHASLANMRAPQMRQTIVSADPAVQVVVSVLSCSLGGACAQDGQTLPDATQSAGDEVAAPRFGDAPACAAARDGYVALIAGIGEGHGFLKANAGTISRAEIQRQIRTAEDRLRRAMAWLRRRRGWRRAVRRRPRRACQR